MICNLTVLVRAKNDDQFNQFVACVRELCDSNANVAISGWREGQVQMTYFLGIDGISHIHKIQSAALEVLRHAKDKTYVKDVELRFSIVGSMNV